MPELRIALAGGGTGGHIYPNLAVLEELERRLGPESISSMLLVSERPIDATIAAAESRRATPIPAAPVGLSPKALAKLVLGWGSAVRAARGAIQALRADVVLATGGFVSAPVMMAARAERVPLVLLNLDAVAGKANRWVGRKARIRLTSADGPGVPRSWERVRPVVREAAMPRGTPSECRLRLGLAPERLTLLVTGGSQGARSINDLMLELAAQHPGAFQNWQILHQCGDKGVEALAAGYSATGVQARCEQYLADMASAWGAADLAIARCGASSVAEIWAAGVPSVLLPYPYHRDEHQAANARPLVEVGGAIIERDRIRGAANMEGAGNTILRLLRDDAERDRMRESLASLGPTDGAQTVADRVLELIGRGAPG